jgi:serine/threonine-protein kinase
MARLSLLAVLATAGAPRDEPRLRPARYLRTPSYIVSTSSMTMKPPAMGDVIADKYQLVRMLGRGSTGEVWLARHKTLVEGVAIKLLTQTLWAGGEEERIGATTRFRFEAQIAARLARKTRHIVRVTDHGEADDVAYLVMELLDGMTLETKLLAGQSLSPVDVQTLVKHVARALEYAHAERVLHRDLKPSNLFLTRGEDGEMLVKTLDFGIAQIMRGRASTGSFSTDRDLVFGTPGYMSPEQALGHADLDARCDLWSLATIAYESLTNELPVAGTTVNELINAVRSGRTTPVRQYRPDLPQSVGAFFERAFAEDVDARFATAAELTRAFDVAFAPEPALDIVVALEMPSCPPVALTGRGRDGTEARLPRRPRAMPIALGLVALLATGFVGTTWRSLARSVEKLSHFPVALASYESPRASTPATPQPDLDTTALAIPSLRMAPVLTASASIQEMTAGSRPHGTSETTSASDVVAPARHVVASVARTSAPKKPAFSALAPVEETFTKPLEAVSPKPECQPPYVVDTTTGKKHWKLECL